MLSWFEELTSFFFVESSAFWKKNVRVLKIERSLVRFCIFKSDFNQRDYVESIAHRCSSPARVLFLNLFFSVRTHVILFSERWINSLVSRRTLVAHFDLEKLFLFRTRQYDQRNSDDWLRSVFILAQATVISQASVFFSWSVNSLKFPNFYQREELISEAVHAAVACSFDCASVAWELVFSFKMSSKWNFRAFLAGI